MASGIAARSMSSICRWKMSGPSLSKPMINPAHRSSPWRSTACTRPAMSPRTFWVFRVSRSESADGLSIPTKTLQKPASVIARMSAGSSARLSDASV